MTKSSLLSSQEASNATTVPCLLIGLRPPFRHKKYLQRNNVSSFRFRITGHQFLDLFVCAVYNNYQIDVDAAGRATA